MRHDNNKMLSTVENILSTKTAEQTMSPLCIMPLSIASYHLDEVQSPAFYF